VESWRHLGIQATAVCGRLGGFFAEAKKGDKRISSEEFDETGRNRHLTGGNGENRDSFMLVSQSQVHSVVHLVHVNGVAVKTLRGSSSEETQNE
jgi:hypothetical protein